MTKEYYNNKVNAVTGAANRLYKDEKGQGMAEYGLIIALVAITVIGGLTYLGAKLFKKFSDVSDAMGD